MLSVSNGWFVLALCSLHFYFLGKYEAPTHCPRWRHAIHESKCTQFNFYYYYCANSLLTRPLYFATDEHETKAKFKSTNVQFRYQPLARRSSLGRKCQCLSKAREFKSTSLLFPKTATQFATTKRLGRRWQPVIVKTKNESEIAAILQSNQLGRRQECLFLSQEGKPQNTTFLQCQQLGVSWG